MEKKIKNIINGDCIEVMKTLDEGSIDLIVTSPPYGVGIEYDAHQDDMEWEQYVKFTYSFFYFILIYQYEKYRKKIS